MRESQCGVVALAEGDTHLGLVELLVVNAEDGLQHGAINRGRIHLRVYNDGGD